MKLGSAAPLLLALVASSVADDSDVCLRTALYPPNNVSPGPTVDIPSVGKVLGLDRKEYPSVAEFRGIPYAEKARRWQPPVMSRGWKGETFEATSYGNVCVQPMIHGTTLECPSDPMDEDCLVLHIGAPKAALEGGGGGGKLDKKKKHKTKKLPVMIYFYGGAYQFGAGFENDPAALVSASGDEVVVVTLNYRVGVLGFLGGDEVMSRTNGSGGGNFGIQDQRLAMRWVKENIGAFGGDGDDVTIFGQSAGGTSVLFHLVQKESFGLYQKAIIQSGAHNMWENAFDSIAMANKRYEGLLEAVGCEDMDCLLDADAHALDDAAFSHMELGGSGTFEPVVDGVSLTDTLGALFDKKKFNKEVPIILGSCRDEYGSRQFTKEMSEEEFDHLYSDMKTEKLDELKRLYDPKVYDYPEDLGGYSQWIWMNIRIDGETLMPNVSGLHAHCVHVWLARQLRDGGSPSVRLFRFEKSPNFSHEQFVVHGIDPYYVFNMMVYPAYLAQETGDYEWKDVATKDDKKMGRRMSRYWSNFAISGDPNSRRALVGLRSRADESLAQWPEFTTEAESVLRMEDHSKGGIRAEVDLIKEVCDWHLDYAHSMGMMYPPKTEEVKVA